MKTSRYETILENLLTNLNSKVEKCEKHNDSLWGSKNYWDPVSFLGTPIPTVQYSTPSLDISDFLNFFYEVNGFFLNPTLICLLRDIDYFKNKDFYLKQQRRSGSTTFLTTLAAYGCLRGLDVAVAADDFSWLHRLTKRVYGIIQSPASRKYSYNVNMNNFKNPNFLLVDGNINSSRHGYDLVLYDVTDSHDTDIDKWFKIMKSYSLNLNGIICAIKNV